MMTSQMENVFFQSAMQGLIREDHELRELFGKNGGRYHRQHNGVACLYETTMVYIVMKQLLRAKFPLTAVWEYPYPGRPEWKADLGLLNDEGSLNSLVEFKIWSSEHGREIMGDVQKFRKSGFHGSRYICAVEPLGGELQRNREFLDGFPGVQVLGCDGFLTCAYSQKNQGLGQAWVNVYLLRVID